MGRLCQSGERLLKDCPFERITDYSRSEHEPSMLSYAMKCKECGEVSFCSKRDPDYVEGDV